MNEKEPSTTKANRIYWLDNLRTFMIFLVILYHAGLVYESSGIPAPWWIVDDPSTNNLTGILNIIVDIFVMPAIFFIAGFFAPLSLKNRKGWAFLKSKFKRLIIPWIIAVFTLIPIYKVIFLYSRNLPQENWTTYFHFNAMWSQNWLWFLPVLFLFSSLYLLLSKVKIRLSEISIKIAILAAFLIGFAYSFGMDFFGFRGWTKTILIDFQNERLLIYFLVFLVGARCFSLKVFDEKPKSKMLYHIINSISWIPVTAYIFFLLYPWFKPGSFIVSKLIHKLILWFSFLLSLLCLLYTMINTFRYYLNKQGKITKELNRNSYYVYIIHVIVIGALALTMLNTEIPSLLKYLILTVSSYIACNLIISFSRKVSDRIINKS